MTAKMESGKDSLKKCFKQRKIKNIGLCQDEVGEFKALEKDCNSWDNRENGRRPWQMMDRDPMAWILF